MSGRVTEPVAIELYTIPEAAVALRVPEGWLRKKVTAGLVPHTRLGKHVRFTTDHLQRIVTTGAVEPTAAPSHSLPFGLSPRARQPRVSPVTSDPNPRASA